MKLVTARRTKDSNGSTITHRRDTYLPSVDLPWRILHTTRRWFGRHCRPIRARRKFSKVQITGLCTINTNLVFETL